MSYIVSAHVREELMTCQIGEPTLRAVVEHPEQVVAAKQGIECRQSKVVFPNGKTYVVRVMLNLDTNPPTVVTAYRTSKITKYWQTL